MYRISFRWAFLSRISWGVRERRGILEGRTKLSKAKHGVRSAVYINYTFDRRFLVGRTRSKLLGYTVSLEIFFKSKKRLIIEVSKFFFLMLRNIFLILFLRFYILNKFFKRFKIEFRFRCAIWSWWEFYFTSSSGNFYDVWEIGLCNKKTDQKELNLILFQTLRWLK